MSGNITCSPTVQKIPGISTACAVPLQGNNTSRLQACCGVNTVVQYPEMMIAGAPNCAAYCNITGAFYNESSVYECLTAGDNVHPTELTCRNGNKESKGVSRGVDRAVVLGCLVVSAVWGFGMGGL